MLPSLDGGHFSMMSRSGWDNVMLQVASHRNVGLFIFPTLFLIDQEENCATFQGKTTYLITLAVNHLQANITVSSYPMFT